MEKQNDKAMTISLKVNTRGVINENVRVITVEGVSPGAGDSNLGEDSLDVGPVSHSSSPTVNRYRHFYIVYFTNRIRYEKTTSMQ